MQDTGGLGQFRLVMVDETDGGSWPQDFSPLVGMGQDEMIAHVEGLNIGRDITKGDFYILFKGDIAINRP